MKRELSDSQKVKKELTKKFPDLKISVRGGYATHTAKIDVAIMEIKNSFINPVQDYEHDIHFINISDTKQVHGLIAMNLIDKGYSHARFENFTGKTKKVIGEIFQVIQKYYGTYEAGDAMVDSFDNYFYDIDFGKWDKSLIYNGIAIDEIFENLTYEEEKEYPYKNIITTGAPTEYKDFKELQKLHLEYLLSLMPTAAKTLTTKKTAAPQGGNCFDDIFQNATIEDFEHTKTKEILKVLKLKDKLSRDEFNLFRTEMKERALGYYSRFAKGFILEEEGLLCKTA